MKWLLIAVLLAIMQAPPPVPGKAANQLGGSGQHVQNNASNNQNAPPASGPGGNQDEGQAQARHDERETIIIREPAAVTHKDTWDKAYVVFAGLLVIVGALGVGYAIKTLRAIERQADLLAEQISLMRDTAQRQLRAYVLVSAALLKFKRPDVPEVQVHFKNFGQTPAYEMDGWIGMYIGDYPLASILPPAPYNLRKGKEPLAPGRVSIHIIPRDPPIPAEYVRLLGTPQGTIYVYGEIRYKDAFKADRYLKYRLIHGGLEAAKTFEKDGVLCALLKPDTEGNEAN